MRNIEDATPIDVMRWSALKNFKRSEFEPGADHMEFDTLILIDRLRGQLGKPIVIHCGWADDGHSKKSQHYCGRALDLHVVGASPAEVFDAALEIGFVGIGFYPYWNNPGFHLDTREADPIFWYQNKAGKYIYQTQEELREFLENA